MIPVVQLYVPYGHCKWTLWIELDRSLYSSFVLLLTHIQSHNWFPYLVLLSGINLDFL